MWKTPEYQALLTAQRALEVALKPHADGNGVEVYPEPRDAAMVASALARVIDQKRVMRGQPAPKPVDVSPKTRKRKPQGPDAWTDPTAPPPPPK